MVITVLAVKGGVAKTTTAIHIAGYLAEHAPTILIDRDYNESALQWAEKGRLTFPVVSSADAQKALRNSPRHIVIDTPARPTRQELASLGTRGDLVIVPTTPDAMAIQALTRTIRVLKEAGSAPFKVLLTIVPPFPSREGTKARAALERAGLDVFRRDIPRAAAFPKAALEGVLVNEVRDRRAMSCYLAYGEVAREALR